VGRIRTGGETWSLSGTKKLEYLGDANKNNRVGQGKGEEEHKQGKRGRGPEWSKKMFFTPQLLSKFKGLVTEKEKRGGKTGGRTKKMKLRKKRVARTSNAHEGVEKIKRRTTAYVAAHTWNWSC